MPRRVAITGIGIICPLAKDLETFWSNALAGKGIAAPIPETWREYADYQSTLWAPLPEIDFADYGIGKPQQIQTDSSALLALVSAAQAIDDAGLSVTEVNPRKHQHRIEGIDSERGGVFAGTGIGGIQTMLSAHAYQINARNKTSLSQSAGGDYDALIARMRIPRRFNPFTISMTMPNAISSNIGIKYSLNGLNNTTTAACAAGSIAIGQAFRAIRNNYVDFAIAGGAENLSDEAGGIFKGFDLSGALVQDCSDPRTANRPFDKQRSGFLFAEGGSAMLVLEEMESAKARGARIYAELAGYGESFDAHSMMMIDSSGQQIERALRSAISDAGLQPEDIDYVNAHGTSTIVNDEVESVVIERVIGDKVMINSTKGLIGHSMGASGAIEAAVTAMTLLHQTTHPNRNLANPVRDLNFVVSPTTTPINAAISESFAFGGHNAVLAFKRNN